MAWVETDHSDHRVSTPCYVQGRQLLDQAAQSHIQPGLECLQGWGIHNLLRQPVSVCNKWNKAVLQAGRLGIPVTQKESDSPAFGAYCYNCYISKCNLNFFFFFFFCFSLKRSQACDSDMMFPKTIQNSNNANMLSDSKWWLSSLFQGKLLKKSKSTLLPRTALLYHISN